MLLGRLGKRSREQKNNDIGDKLTPVSLELWALTIVRDASGLQQRRVNWASVESILPQHRTHLYTDMPDIGIHRAICGQHLQKNVILPIMSIWVIRVFMLLHSSNQNKRQNRKKKERCFIFGGCVCVCEREKQKLIIKMDWMLIFLINLHIIFYLLSLKLVLLLSLLYRFKKLGRTGLNK